MSGRGGGRRPEGPPLSQPCRDGGGRGRGAAFPSLPSSAVAAASSSAVAPASSSTASLSREVEKLALQSTAPASNLPPSSKKLLKIPARPGSGTVGQKIIIRANHFLVEVADKDLHHYDVAITPEVTSKNVNREVICQLVRLYRDSHLSNRTPAYDGRKSLYTAGPLPFTSKEFVVKLADKERQAGANKNVKPVVVNKEKPPRMEREFKVAIKFAAKTDLFHLQQFLKGRQRDVPQETIQVLDVVLRESPSTNYTVVGRSFFDVSLGQIGDLGDGLEYWRGFYQSLRPTQMGMSLNIDVSARAFYQPIPATEFVAKYLNLRDLSRPLTDRDRIKISKALKGLRVELSHGEHVKKYKVIGVSVDPTNQLMFTNSEGNKLSVAQYFCERYGIMLKCPFMPSLQAGSVAKPIYLPMELCKIVDGQRYSKKLNEKQVTALLRATCQRPNEREKSIKEMVRRNNYNSDSLVNKEFGIQVVDGLTAVNARVLPAPMLKYHESGKERSVDPRVGQWNMINKKMVNGGTVDHWTCISFSSRMRQDMVYQFCHDLVSMCSSKGMVFNPNPFLPIQLCNSNKLEMSLANVNSQSNAKFESMGQCNRRLQLLIIILPEVSGSYGRIKRICETELGIVSQCCQPHQAQKLNKQYLENVSLKVNVKVGGRNSVLVDAFNRRMPLVSDMPTIIIGADVTHPQPGEDSSPSIAAVVASMDWPEVSKYRALVSAQPHRVEMIEDLYKATNDEKKGLVHGGMIREHLIAFRKSTGYKPHRIIFYRDGVSEGQFTQVLLEEMDAIRKACVSLEENYLPKVTFVVVQKRHHTRFFTDDRQNMDRSGNVMPGTVVDTKICHPTEFDFYLNSHAGIQGTSRPAHYHVLYDENNFTADQLQMLTNNLCYTYARCTRSVSIVPPAYYAHLAAFRARYYLDGFELSDSGSTSGATMGRSTRDLTSAVRPLPGIKDNVKDVMFFC